jgi:hypothetical protein
MKHSHAETLRAIIILTGHGFGVSLNFRHDIWLLQEEGRRVSRIQYTLSQLDYIDEVLYSGDSGVYCAGLILFFLARMTYLRANLMISNAPEDLRSAPVQTLCASQKDFRMPCSAGLRRRCDWWRRTGRSCICSASYTTSHSCRS